MFLDIFGHPNYLLELLYYIDYSAGTQLCQTNRQILQICRDNSIIRAIFQKKRSEYILNLTDLFLTGISLSDNPLIIVIYHNDLDIINELIDYGYDVRYLRSRYNVRPYDSEWVIEQFSIINELLNRGYDPSVKNNIMIGLLSRYGKLKLVERLLSDKRVDPSANNNFALRIASKMGYINIVKLLLQDIRVNPTANNNEALHLAFQTRNYSIAGLLIRDNRTQVRDNIFIAAQYGYLEVVESLMSNSLINDVMYIAIKFGQEAIIDKYIQDVRFEPARDDNKTIYLASKKGYLLIVNKLLQDPSVDPSANYNRAIRFACKKGHLDVVQRLLQDPRVNPAACNNNCIRWVSQKGHLEIVELLLLDSRVDPSDRNNGAIRLASARGRYEVVKRLLQDDRVDPTDKDNGAIRYASKKRKFISVVELLYQDIRVRSSLKRVSSKSSQIFYKQLLVPYIKLVSNN